MASKVILTDYQAGVRDAHKDILMLNGVEEAEAEQRALQKALQAKPKVAPSPKRSPTIRRTLSHILVPVPKRDSTHPLSSPKRRRRGNIDDHFTEPTPSPKRRRPDDEDDLTTKMSRMRTYSSPSISRTSSSKRTTPMRRPSKSKSSTPYTNSVLHDDNEYVDTSDDDEDEDSEPPAPSRSNSSRTVTKKAEFDAVVTSIVHRTVRKFFRHEFKVENSDRGAQAKEKPRMSKFRSHYGNPESFVFRNRLAKEGQKIFYEAVVMDGQVYEVGDVVLVEPGHDGRKGRQLNYQSEAAQSVNRFANDYWFIKISYFFRNDGENMFHGQWLEHGSKTVLQEVAHSRGLFLTHACSDAPLSSIFRKIEVKFSKPEKEDDEDPEGDTFFCSFVWDSQSVSFVDLPREEEREADLAFSDSYRACHSCVLAEKSDAIRQIQHTNHCISQFGINYHMYDVVYVVPNDGDVLRIAQIIRISDLASSSEASVTVQMLRHVDTHLNSSFVDERLLRLGTTTKTIPFEDVQGKAYVKYFDSASDDEIQTWSRGDDHFYVLAKISQCSDCMEEHQRLLDKSDKFLALDKPIQGFELFSGAGGLGTGLNLSGFVETVAAVEWDVHAAETYFRNHPDTTVYCQEVNKVLQYLIDSKKARGKIAPLKSRSGGYCEPLPKIGDIDLISGGPPCQAFSGANHNPQPDDMRATLPFTMISFLEIYEAKYFILENVTGIMRFRLMGEMGETKHSIDGGIKHGVFKLIVRSLLALGYQVRVKVLQAVNYGAPQGRERVIFWGTKQGTKIPEFPIPTHVYSAKEYGLLEHPDIKLSKPTRSLDSEAPHPYAPFKAVTVNDAIGDLAGFDWENPHIILKATMKDKTETQIREKTFPTFTAIDKNKLPGPIFAQYKHDPFTLYQKLMREGMGAMVEEHVTPTFDPGVVERSTMIPLNPDAHHHDLPPELQQQKKTKNHNHIYFGRLNENGQFRTVMTHSSPATKGATLLHPTQKRTITVREIARCQGFPDKYTFMKDHTSVEVRRAYKQIGNAVPVPLALALGKSLGAALVAKWPGNDQEHEPTPEPQSKRAQSLEL